MPARPAAVEALARTLRDKVVRAVRDGVDTSPARRADAVALATLTDEIAALRAEVTALRGDVAHARERTDELEFRLRRDLRTAQDIAATEQSAAFAVEYMPRVTITESPRATLDLALSAVTGRGLALEFGVAGGDTLRAIVEGLPDHATYGFDVFTGLPETWRSGFPAGEFRQDGLPDVPGAQLVPGLFDETLPAFLAEHDDPVAFVHLDADLYSSTVTVLDALAPRLEAGTVLVFDEFFNFPGWPAHEYRAWTEFCARTGTAFEYLAYTGDNEQVALVLR